MKVHQIRLCDLTSGSDARQYRRRIASLANRQSDAMSTLKFKLEVPTSLNPMSFETIKKAYKTVEGVGEGTLTHYLCSLILSGFRIFQKNSEADAFSNRRVYDDEAFAAVAKEVFGGTFINFVPSKIKIRLEKTVRSTGGKNNSFTPEVLMEEYAKDWFKAPRGTDLTKVEKILHDIAIALTQRFDSFSALGKDVESGLRDVDAVLNQYGNFPSIADMYRKSKENVALPTKSVIVFDSESTFFSSDTPWALHVVVAKILKECPDEGMRSKFVKENLTTANSNGLSWVFGAGLEFFRTKSVEEIARAYGVPNAKIEAVVQVKRAADALCAQNLLGNGKGSMLSYAYYRSSFGGHIDSWVSNYLNRLEELEDLFSKLPQRLRLPLAIQSDRTDFLLSNKINQGDIDALCERFDDLRHQTQTSLNNLLGRGANVIEDDCLIISRFTSVINRLIAISQQIRNLLDQASKDKESGYKGLKEQCEKEWAAWDSIKNFPKLNQLTGGIADVQGELNMLAEHFPLILEAQKNYFQRIQDYGLSDVFDAFEVEETKKLQKRPFDRGKVTATELALGRFLNQIGRRVRIGQNRIYAKVIEWFKSEAVFENTKDFNLYFCNKKGSLYVSPFATGRHVGYKLSIHVRNNPKALIASFARLMESISSETYTEWEEQEAKVNLEKIWYSMRLSTLNVSIPSALATPWLPDQYKDALTEDLRFELSKGTVSSSAVQRIFNIYASLIGGVINHASSGEFLLAS